MAYNTDPSIYSQSDEQVYILRACPDTGRFLDIGAWDGQTLSNTAALADRGWTGVLVEPQAKAFAKLEAKYGSREGFSLLNVAVCMASGEVDFWESDDLVSTTSEEFYKVRSIGDTYTGRRKVRAIAFKELLAEHGTFDFVSIDTEGTSADLFFAIDFATCRPKCICVEHDLKSEEICRYAGRFGYRKIMQNAENVILQCEQ